MVKNLMQPHGNRISAIVEVMTKCAHPISSYQSTPNPAVVPATRLVPDPQLLTTTAMMTLAIQPAANAAIPFGSGSKVANVSYRAKAAARIRLSQKPCHPA
jgi:hypothetical protein